MTALAMAEAPAVEEELLPASASVADLKAGSPASERYVFDEAFQAKIAALCLRDPTFVGRVEGLIRPEYFESSAHAALVNIANRYYEKYRKIPGDRTTLSALIRHDVVKKVLQKEHVTGIVAALRDRDPAALAAGAEPGLFQVDISDRDLVVEEVATFARHQAVSNALLESVDLIEKRDFDAVEKRMKVALDTGSHSEMGLYDYGAMIENRTRDRRDRASGKLAPTGITTGDPDLDKLLYHRGWGRRELSVLMGPAKAGKTSALLDFGIKACGSAYKYNVLYVTLEVSADIISQRIDANVSDTTMSDLDRMPGSVEAEVKRYMAGAGKFIVQEFPTGQMRVSDLRRLIERFKSKGIVFDLVVVDYADLMQPERTTDSAIENSKAVYVNLRGLAMVENFAILTATQTNREGAKKAVATMTDVADDFNKIRIADIVISINKTEEERKLKEARLHFAACRNQEGGFTVRIRQVPEKMQFNVENLGTD